MLHAILLAVWAFIACYEMLGPKIFMGRPMVAGTVAGLIIGHLTLGMAVGGTIELSALGLYTYGGASIPDFLTGAIVGTAAAVANAVYHATGTRVRDLPIRPDKLIGALARCNR